MNDCRVIVLFRGIPPSVTLHALITRQVERLQELVAKAGMLEAKVERKTWPCHPPSIQVTLKLDLPEGELTACAGDFGCSNAYTATETAFNRLRARVARLPVPRAGEPVRIEAPLSASHGR